MQVQPKAPIKLHKTGQFMLEHNVEYKLVNRYALIDLLKSKGILIADEFREDLDAIKTQAIKQGLSKDQVEKYADSCARELFTENKLGTAILRGIRSFVKEPVSADGKIKEGIANHFAAYGLRIPGLTGFYANKRVIRNLVTDAGRAGVASRINGSGGEAAFTWIAMGTGTNAAANGDTTLQTESSTSGLSRANSTASRVTTTVTNDTAQLVNTFTITGTVAVTESGVLNASSVGTLLCRQTFSAINVVNGDSLQVTWKVKAA